MKMICIYYNLFYTPFYSDQPGHLGCYTHNVSAVVPSGLLQMSIFILGKRFRILNQAFSQCMGLDCSYSAFHALLIPLINKFLFEELQLCIRQCY